MTSPSTIDDVLLAVQRITRVGVRDIKGRGQSYAVRSARVLTYFVASQCFGAGCRAMGKFIDRDPTTVSSSVRRVRICKRFDPELVDRVEEEATAIAAARRQGCANYAGSPIYAVMES